MRPVLPRSIFGQLLLSQLALFALLAVAVPALVLVALRRTADDYVAGRLDADAHTVAQAVAGGGRLDRATLRGRLGPLYVAPWGSRAFRVTDADGRTLDEEGVGAAVPPRPAPARPASAVATLAHVGRLDVYRRRFVIDGRTLDVAVAQDRTRPEVIVDDVVADALRRSLWVIPLVLVASTMTGLAVIARVTRQLRAASADADAIAPSSIDRRIDLGALPVEARGLAVAANAALDRVAAGYRRQSEFAASVAHELRTPLSLITLRCDALPESPERARLRAAVDQAAHVIDQLMDLSAVEARVTALEAVDLAAIVRDAVEASAPIVFRSGRSIEADGAQAAPAMGNAGLLRIAVANLVDNAVRHTPPGTHIVVRSDGASVVVSDDGPGLVRGEGDERFRSAGHGRTDGAGLGLAIVARIMAAMGGTMHVGAGRPGATIELRLEHPSA